MALSVERLRAGGAYILRTSMSEKIIALLVQFVTHVIDVGGYAGIAALLAANSAGIPLPSELIMPFSGALTIFHVDSLGQLVLPGRFGNGNLWLGLICVAMAGAVGCNVGSAIAYWIGAKGGRPLVERYGRWVLMSHHDLDRMTWFFLKYGSITILVGRMLPVVQTFVAFPAGIARMPRLRFHLYTTLGSLCWYFCLATAGMKLGEKWHTDPRLQEWFHRFHLSVEIALLVGVVWFVWTHVNRAREAKAA
jgi:membrane protein DedA with SNARE-associated domain